MKVEENQESKSLVNEAEDYMRLYDEELPESYLRQRRV